MKKHIGIVHKSKGQQNISLILMFDLLVTLTFDLDLGNFVRRKLLCSRKQGKLAHLFLEKNARSNLTHKNLLKEFKKTLSTTLKSESLTCNKSKIVYKVENFKNFN